MTPSQDSEVIMMNNVYRERFPNAVTQMEEKLKVFGCAFFQILYTIYISTR